MFGKLFARAGFCAAFFGILAIVVGTAWAAETLTDAQARQAYSYQITTDDGVPPHTFSLVSGTLPDGLTVSPTGLIAGTPSIWASGGFYNFMVSVDDSAGAPTDYGIFDIYVDYPPQPNDPVVEVQTSYATPIDIDVGQFVMGDWTTVTLGGVYGGTASLNGTVITFTPSDGVTGEQNVFYNVCDRERPDFCRINGGILVNVQYPLAPVVHDFSAATDENGVIVVDLDPYSDLPEQSYVVDTSIVFPPTKGSASDHGGGRIIYTATDPCGADRNDILTYSITDQYGQVSNVATMTINITRPLSCDPLDLPPKSLRGKVGEPFSQVFSASGGTEPYAFTPASGLPDGLTFSGDTISGVPATEGSFDFYLAVADADGRTGDQFYPITIDPADPAGTPFAADYAVGADFNGPAVEINLASLTTGDWNHFEIVTQPEKGTLLENGMFVSYSPSEGESGADSFTWRAIGPGGNSNIATVSVTISEAPVGLPVAIDHEVLLSPTEGGSVDLTYGASGAPFVSSEIMGSVPAEVGEFTLSGTRLSFQPHVAFDGIAKVGYRLENAAGKSNVAEVRFIVAPRADPSKDPEVIGLLTAQAEAAKKFAGDQITTITGRLESLHDEGYCERENAIHLLLGYAAGGDDPDDDSKDSVTLSGKSKADCDWAIWSGGYVSLAEYANDGIDFSSTAVGLTAGIDYRFTPSFVGGIAVGYGSEKSEIGSNGTESAAEAISAALYSSWHPKSGIYVDGILGYQHLSYDSRRYVTPNGEFAYGNRTGNQVFGSLTTGYEIRKDGFVVAPYVGVRGSHGVLDGFTETGGGIYALSYGDQTVTSISGVVGVRAEYEIKKPWGTLTPSVRAEYKHDFVGDSDVAIGYADIGTKPYRAEIKGRGRDSVTVGVGVKAKLKKGWSIESTLSSTFGNGKPSHRIGVRATYEFCGLFVPQSACGPQPKTVPIKARAGKAVKGESKKRRQ